MTEERSCKTCQFHFGNSKLGVICDKIVGLCHCYSKWQPIAREKPMEKIQMTEEQARELFKDWAQYCTTGEDSFVLFLKQKGYIRKSAVEEAEEEYIAHKEGKNCFVAEIVMDKMYLAIQELKSEIARLKK